VTRPQTVQSVSH